MEKNRGGGMSAEEAANFLRIVKMLHGVEEPEIVHRKLVDDFKRAAAYVGFDESTTSLPSSKYPEDAMLILYGLYKQATELTDDIPLPESSDELEQKLFQSRIGMLCMPPTLAMQNFVGTVQRVDPEWRARVSIFTAEPLEDFKLNADVAQLQHELQMMGSSQKEFEFLLWQKALLRKSTQA